MKLELDGRTFHLQPLLSEPNLWKIIEDQDILDDDASLILGLVMTYVDDLFLVSQLKLIQELVKGIRQLWATTQPEYVSEAPVRFLGMDVSRVKTEHGWAWKITQSSYVTDLLQKEEDLRPRKIPITRDQGLETAPLRKERWHQPHPATCFLTLSDF